MSKVNKLTTALIWLLRLLELAFAVILLGATGYLARQARHTHRGATRRIIVPLIISAIAIVEVLLFALTFFLKTVPAFLLFAFLDFCIWCVYLAAAGVYRKNFNGPPLDNDLAPYLINARRRAGLPSHSGRIQNLVRLVAGLIIIQIIFFFFTMLLTAYRAYRARSKVHQGPNEKMGFNRLRNPEDQAHINGNGGMMVPDIGRQHDTANLNANAQTPAGHDAGGIVEGDVQRPIGSYRSEQERVTSTTEGTTRGEYV